MLSPVRAVVAVVVVLAAALAGSGAAAAQPADGEAPPGTDDVAITTADGVELDATIYRPETTDPAPAVVLAHGFGGDKGDVVATAQRLADDGYVALAYSARGFGASGGSIALDAAVEGGDVGALVDWLAEQRSVMLDGPGDPTVGVTGASYGGGISLLAAARDDRIDAIVPIVAWNSLVTSLAPDAAAADGEAGVFKSRWAGLLFAAGSGPGGFGTDGAASPGDGGAGAQERPSPDGPGGAAGPQGTGDPVCGRFASPVCDAYATIARTGAVDAEAQERLALADVPDGVISAPTLLIQARSDTLFGLEQSVANARATTGPTRLLWIDGGHGAPGNEANRERVTDATVDWFDRWLRGDEAAVEQIGGLTWRDGPSGQLRSVDEFPPATSPEELPLQSQGGGTPPVVSPPGGVPAALSTLPGLGGVGSLLPATDLPGQNIAFDSAPLDRDLDVVGAAVTRLRLDGRTDQVRLFAKLYEVSSDGSTTLIQSQVAPLQVDDVPATVTVELPTLAHRFVAGSRVRLVLAATDQAFANRREADVYDIAPADGGGVLRLDVPVLEAGVAPLPRTSLVVPFAVLAAALAAVGAVLLARRRRSGAISRRMRREMAHESSGQVDGTRSGDGKSSSAVAAPNASALGTGSTDARGGRDAPPVEIRRLSKTYGDGYVAVDDVSFTVGHGQVFGLLGPNGAGKTTLLRVLLGLIQPTDGQARIFGEPMRPGHPVLARVGALVEGPGFAPYLSGIDNLRLYWDAGTQHAESDRDAVFSRALEVAALGDALQRPVKTYSHGMKQRLAIAQALLGDPDLLVLDEPTDGLDPGQIRGMRDVLAGLATEGRTVLVSSHLLAEVEQVCSHVAVMQRGHLVTTGPVSDLVTASGTVVVQTPDRERARQVISDIVGPGSVRSQSEGLIVDTNSTGPGEIVAALVHAGVSVEGVAPRQRLEDAFLTLLEEDA